MAQISIDEQLKEQFDGIHKQFDRLHRTVVWIGSIINIELLVLIATQL